MTMVSSISGETKTLAKLVWRRLAESKGEMRTRRWTPVSPLSRPKAKSPEMVKVADLMPASSPSWISLISTLKFWRSPQRMYMRMSISAQSWDSVPPAPGCTTTMALSGSVSSESMVFDSSFSAKSTREGISRARSGSVFSPSLGEFEVGFDVVGAAGEFGVVGEEGFEALAFAHEWLRTRGVGPDGGVGDFFFDGG